MPLVAIIVIGGIIGGGYIYFRRGISEREGTIEVPVNSRVTVLSDGYGIPKISADNKQDLFFAQGYIQAQDRLWQMDLSRRAVSGRLAEIFGEDYLEIDFFLRSLLMYHTAEQSIDKIDSSTKKLLESYTSGINAYLQQNSNNLPPEFTLLRYTPEEWRVVDTIAIGKYMAWDLGGNMDTELFLWAALEALPEEKARELFPSYPEDGPTIVEDIRAYLPEEGHSTSGLLSMLDLVNTLSTGIAGQEMGSNNWVLSGERTASGKPLLANDMHLGMGLPSIWYQTRLEIPGEMALNGVIFPGVPGIIVGSNGHLAWGVTNVGPDVQDLYLERQHPEEPYLFEYDGQWEEAEVLEEEFWVKGRDEAVIHEIVITRNGPLISDVMDEVVEPLSLRWTAHDYTQEIDAVLAFSTARNWEEFKEAMDYFHVPAQNFVFADEEGNIAYRANGRIPIRKKGEGLIPAPGWDPDYQWQGYIPYQELPTLYNPPEGYISTANNRVVDDQYPYFISHQWAPPYRAAAINDFLEEEREFTIQDMIKLQYNVDNLQAKELVPLIKEDLLANEWNEKEAEALDILLKWAEEEPEDDSEKMGPSIYHSFYLKALEETFRDEMGEDLYRNFLSGPCVNTFDRMLKEGSIWFEEAEEGRRGILTRAFSQAVDYLSERLGDDLNDWQWGNLHQILLDHPMGAMPLVDRLLNDGPYPMGGSHLTVAAASYPFTAPFMVTNSAPWRSIIAMEEVPVTLENLAGGASGHPLSPHYSDQTPLWLQGDYLRTEMDDRGFKGLPGDDTSTLYLVP